MKNRYAGGFPVLGWKRALFGLTVGLIVIVSAAGAGAWLINREILGRENMDVAAAVILVLGGLLGGLSAGRGEGRLGRCAMVAIGLILVLLFLNLLLFEGNLSGLLPGALAVLGSTGASMLIGGEKRSRNRRTRSYRKYRNR